MDKGITITMGPPSEIANDSGRVAKYGVGRKCHGRVVNFKPYGFFVETDDGGFGLVHGSSIRGWRRGLRFDRVFRYGTEIDVEVIDIDEKTNRMSFACDLPAEYAEKDDDFAADAGVDEDLPPPPSRREIAEKWREENAERSQAAYEWLKTELEDGPLYGPLTNVLCDRFAVPVPVSQWILLFPDFTCYSGKGDNPSDLPAVALSSRAGEVAYWGRIKTRTEDLSEFRNRGEDLTAKYAALMRRLDEKGVFPGARWMREYEKTAKGLVRGSEVYGRADTVERLVIPMLGELGWDVSPANAALVRGDDSTFDVRLYGGAASSGNVALAVKCAPAGSAFDDEHEVVERVLGLYNRLGGDDPSSTKVIWTNGVEWVIFTDLAVTRRIGILSDRTGGKILSETAESDDNAHYRRIVLPVTGETLDWLAAFAGLEEVLGPSRKGA